MKAVIEELDGTVVRYLEHRKILISGNLVEGYASYDTTGLCVKKDAVYILPPGYCVTITER
jgi:hypothetical protein